ncbi:MAG TPA: alanine racemase [Phototrophicaceae bacterium]|nr:alanine racemase [Phototrophicaceae bacterium]
MDIYELETPSILIDLDRMENNILRMQALCDEAGVGLRPHIKTHKIPEIAKMQIEAGAVGIACQKVSEAEVFAQAGLNDILIPYNILGASKTARFADLSLYNRMTCSADNLPTISGLSDAAAALDIRLRVMVELGTEIERTGASIEQAVALAQHIEEDEHLHFAGILVYPSYPSVRPALQEVLAQLDAEGIGVDTVSGGGTGAVLQAREVPELTEVRVGTYVFNDWTTVSRGWCALSDCAMIVRATVVSHPTENRVILDSGSKTLSSDVLEDGYGHLLDYPEARIYKLNEEHAYVDVSACARKPEIGEVVSVLPVHACVVTNLQNMIYGVRGEEVELTWTVTARGLVW